MTASPSYSSPEIKDLASAMLKVQKTLAPASKDSDNPYAKSRYASLNAVVEACREPLISQGIWTIQYPVPVEPGHLGLMTKLVHAPTGQWHASLMVMPLPKSDPQGYGSALTYARRYALATLVGLVSETDDDGIAATPRASEACSSARQPLTRSRRTPAGPGPSSSASMLESLPSLPGVTYQTVEAPGGRLCFTACGDTRRQHRPLQDAGFRWDQARQVWWRYAEIPS